MEDKFLRLVPCPCQHYSKTLGGSVWLGSVVIVAERGVADFDLCSFGPPLLNERAEMLQNGKLVARCVCVLVRRAALALCVVCVLLCPLWGLRALSARCPPRVAGPVRRNYLGDAPMHYLWAPIRPFIGGGHYCVASFTSLLNF